jgi:hypothetical protein
MMRSAGKILQFIVLIVSLLCFSDYEGQAQGLPQYKVTWDYSGQSFASFVEKAESELPVRFFYNDEWIKDLTLGSYPGLSDLNAILDTLFYNRSIYYYPGAHGNYILTRYFAIKSASEKKTENRSFIPGIDYSDDNKETASGNLVVDIGNPADKGKPGEVTISGYVRNQDTREAVPGVTIFLPSLSAGTISNTYGFYSINVPRGSYPVKFSFIGMKEKIIDLNVYGPGEMDVDMRSVLIPLKEAVISADKNVTLQRHEVGVEKVNITSFRLMPTSLGESDIIKSMLLIPGVQSVGEGSAGFNVRGGSADQNLVLLYGAPVYNTSHFFGFFSAVNSDIIKDVTLYKGGIPGRYGGRLSSVLDISARDGNRREFMGNAGISPVTTHFVVEGPIKKDTLFYLISGRTTYSNWLLHLVENPALKNSRAFFSDLNARLSWDYSKTDKFDLSLYYSIDQFRFNSDTSYRYQNNIASIRWRHFFTSRFFSSVTLNNSFYKYDISSLQMPSEAFVLTHSINSTGLKADFTWFPGRHEFNFGTELQRYDVQPGSFLPANDSSFVIPDIIERQRALEAAAYFEDKFTVTENFSVNGGLRFVSYLAMGPQTVFSYSEGFTRSISSVTDTLLFEKMKPYRTYSGPELRFSANLKLNTSSAIKLNYNSTRQYLHLLSNTISISPSDTWKLSDYHIKPQSGEQIAAGFYRMLNKNKIEASVEVYYKKIRNMIDFKGGTDLVMNEFVERDLINVNGKAYGVELLLKKPEGRIRYSAAYTYSRTLIRSSGSFSDELINGGNWFPANFDKPHDLILTFNFLYSRRMSISANYNFSSGRPVTYPVASYRIGDIVLTQYSERNKYRIPNYSRFDISFKLSGNLKSKKIAHPHWIFSLYNVTGRQNVYSVFFRNENNTVKGYYLSVFGRPIPSVSFNFDF